MDEADIPFINRCLNLLDENQRRTGTAPDKKYNWLIIYAGVRVPVFSHSIAYASGRTESFVIDQQPEPYVSGHYDIVRDMDGSSVPYTGSATKNYAIRLGEPND